MRCSHLDGHRRRPRIAFAVRWSCFICAAALSACTLPRVPTLGKSPFSPHEGFWCRRSTALSSSWVSYLGESTVKETNRSFDRSRSKFADPRYRPRGRITKSVTVTTAYNRTILSGTAASAQYKMAKAALHLNSLLITPSLFLLVPHIQADDRSCAHRGEFGWKIRINIVHRSRKAITPKSAGTYFQTSFRPSIGRLTKLSFTREWNKGGLNLDVAANFVKQTGCKVPDFVVAQNRISASTTGESVVCVKRLSTRALKWEVGWCPAISETKGVSEGSFCQGETMGFHRHGGQPMRGTFVQGNFHGPL